MNYNKWLVLTMLFVGLVAGFGIRSQISPAQYILKETGIAGSVFKLNTRTGEMWLVNGSEEYLVVLKTPKKQN